MGVSELWKFQVTTFIYWFVTAVAFVGTISSGERKLFQLRAAPTVTVVAKTWTGR